MLIYYKCRCWGKKICILRSQFHVMKLALLAMRSSEKTPVIKIASRFENINSLYLGEQQTIDKWFPLNKV